MELTMEDKARIFGMYLGSLMVDYSNVPFRVDWSNIRTLQQGGGDSYKLILTTLENISDEDAITVMKMAVNTGKEDYSMLNYFIDGSDSERILVKCGNMILRIYYNGHMILHQSETDIYMPIYNYSDIIDFLRSRSYHLPYRGQSLYDLGIAVKQTSKTEQ